MIGFLLLQIYVCNVDLLGSIVSTRRHLLPRDLPLVPRHVLKLNCCSWNQQKISPAIAVVCGATGLDLGLSSGLVLLGQLSVIPPRWLNLASNGDLVKDSLIHKLLGGLQLHLLPILAVFSYLLQCLYGDSHQVSLHLIRHLQNLFRLRLSFLFARLNQCLVAERTLYAVSWGLGHLLAAVFSGLLLQLSHCLLQLGVDPLPNAGIVEQMLAGSATDLLVTLVIVTADSALVGLLLVLPVLLLRCFFVGHVA